MKTRTSFFIHKKAEDMLANHNLPNLIQLQQEDKITENCPHLTIFCVRSMNVFHTSGCISFIFCSCFGRPSSIDTSENSVSSRATLKLFPTDHIEVNETCKYLAGRRARGRFRCYRNYPVVRSSVSTSADPISQRCPPGGRSECLHPGR